MFTRNPTFLLVSILLLNASPSRAISASGVSPRDVWRPTEVQALEEFLIRKEPGATGGTRLGAQRQIVARQVTAPQMLQGYMAEGLFLERHTRWSPVAAPNAPFNDVYRFAPDRRPPINGQIKFHVSGNPATYLRSLQEDYRTHRYFIPDDHAQKLRTYLDSRISAAATRGDQTSALRLRGYRSRVRGMGFSADDVVRATRRSVAWSRLSLTASNGFGRWAMAANAWGAAGYGNLAGSAALNGGRDAALYATEIYARRVAAGGTRGTLARTLGRSAALRAAATRAATVLSGVGIALTFYELGKTIYGLYKDEQAKRRQVIDLIRQASQVATQLNAEEIRLRTP
jgi:hypothetical protein